MAVSDAVIMMAIAIIVNYLILYKKNRIVGSIAFMLIGIGGIALDPSNAGFTVIIAIIGFLSLLYETIAKGMASQKMFSKN